MAQDEKSRYMILNTLQNLTFLWNISCVLEYRDTVTHAYQKSKVTPLHAREKALSEFSDIVMRMREGADKSLLTPLHVRENKV